MTASTRFYRARLPLLCVALGLAMPAGAQGETDVFVDADLVRQCAGNTPCFTTIQAGVNAAEDPDAQNAGATASVFIFPGTYAESVDISGINGGTETGDLRLIGVDADGNPAAGMVTIDATGLAGDGLHDGGGAPFDGTIVVEGLTVLANGGFNGVDLFTTGPGTFTNVVASDVGGGTGIDYFAQDGDVMMTDCTANNNDIDGFAVFVNSGDLFATRLTAIGNGTNNMGMHANGSAFIVDCTSNDSMSDGAVLSAAVSLTVEGLIAIGNEQNGAELTSNSQSIFVADSLFTNNGNTGVEVDSAGSASIVRTNADDNELFGVYYAVIGDVSMMEVSADENTSSGIRGSVLGAGLTTIAQVHANRNGLPSFSGTGIEIYSVEGIDFDTDFVLDEVNTIENDGQGIRIDVSSPVWTATLSNINANGNGSVGVQVGSATVVSVVDSTMNYNHGNGMRLLARENLLVERVEATLNRGNGCTFYTLGTIACTDMTTNFNGFDGVHVEETDKDEVAILRLTSIGNGLIDDDGDGLDLEGDSALAMNVPEVEASVLDSWIQGNMRHGIVMSGLKEDGMHDVHGCILCENGGAGLAVFRDPTDVDLVFRGGLTVDARGNWWGDPSGPSTVTNPTGTGDGVMGAADFGYGQILITPWIDTINASAAPNPVNVGETATIEFQFADSGGTYFLGSLPGDATGELPFNIHTDNGELTAASGSGASVFDGVNQPNGVLAVSLVPSSPGPATIWLDGPCKLDTFITVNAVSADLSVTKTDDVDPVEIGDFVVYTLTVTNNGPDDANNVTLTDTLPAAAAFVSAAASQGACAEAAGVVTCNLGALANGASATVDVTVQMIAPGVVNNVAEVTADEGDAESSNNIAGETTTVNAPQMPPPGGGNEPPGGQEPPTSQPDDSMDDMSEGMADCGAGLCGFGTIGLMPVMLAGLGLMRGRVRRRRR